MTSLPHRSAPTWGIDRESVLDDVLEEVANRLQAGDPVDRAAILARYPEHAESLLRLLPAVEVMAEFGVSASRLAARGVPPGVGPLETGLGVLGDFRILREIGRGGMGVVYEAEQISLGRRVALKVLPFAAALDSHQLQRFKTEAQAAAQLHHTHIVPVYCVGCERGVHYFAMQYIEGQTLAQAIAERRRTEAPSPPVLPSPPVGEGGPKGRMGGEWDRPHPLAPPLSEPDALAETYVPRSSASAPSSRTREYCRTAAMLGIQAAEALDHAHKFGIVHRDVKPANLLLDGQGSLWIADFGLARLQDDAGLTITGDLLGTLRYMSPEQALAKRGYLDHRTDIYSLGATLYELVTLRPAVDGLDRQEVLRTIAEDEPAPLRKLNSSIPRELETILLKAMSKEPRSRYETAQELADDLRRFLEHRPIKARRPTLTERAAKWARRHRTIVASAILIAMLAAAGLGASLALITRERIETARQRDLARHHRYVTDIRQAYELAQSGQGSDVRESLKKWLPAPGQPEIRNFAWYYLLRLCHDERRTLKGHKGTVFHAEFSPDARTLASCGQDGTVRLWEVATGRPLRTIAAHASEVNTVDFAPDGRTLATAGDDGQIRLWDVPTGGLRATILAHRGSTGVGFTVDGRHLISGGRHDYLVKLWDATTYKFLASTTTTVRQLENGVLSPDGKTLATADGDGYVRLWNPANFTPGKVLRADLGPVYALAFSSDGTRLAAADAGGRVSIWPRQAGEPRDRSRDQPQNYDSEATVCLAHLADAHALAFLPGDQIVVSADSQAVLRLSDATTGHALAVLNGHTGKIWGVSVSPDRATMATASGDGTVKLWDAGLPRRLIAIPAPNMAGPLAFTPDGRTLVTADAVDNAPDVTAAPKLVVRGFDPKTGAERFHHRLEIGFKTTGYVLTTAGAFVLLSSPYDTATIWEVATGKRLASINSYEGVCPAPAGFVGVASQGGPVELVDPFTAQRRALKGTEANTCVASSLDAHVIALRSEEKLAIWDLELNQAQRTRHGVRTAWSVATFSPDATILAVGTTAPRGSIQLWDVTTLELLDSLPGHAAVVNDLAFSPDGKTLASLGGEGAVKLWDVATRVEMLTLRFPFRISPLLRFSPDGRTLAFRGFTDINTGKGSVYLVPTALPEDLGSEEVP